MTKSNQFFAKAVGMPFLGWTTLTALIVPLWICTAAASDNIGYCNAVQNKIGFIRYPLGTIGAWTTAAGDTADVITRAPRVYPCVNDVVTRGEKDDWRSSVSGDPSLLTIQYAKDKPSGAARVVMSVTPHVTVFKTTFPTNARKTYMVFDFRRATVDKWAALYSWTNRTVSRVDPRTFQATIGEPGKKGAFYEIHFSVPCTAWGTIDSSGRNTEGASSETDEGPIMYAQFDSSPVTVAVAESFTSLQKAGEFLDSEFTDFDAVHQKCRAAWNKVLDRVELEGSETSKRMAYTALYTMYANIINGSDGSRYASLYPRPLSVASSAYWEFIGGYHSCAWDNTRATYPFLLLAYPEVMTDVVNTYLARQKRDGYMGGDSCLFTGTRTANIRQTPVLVAQAYYSAVPADYPEIYEAMKKDFANDRFVEGLRTKGYLTGPATGGWSCSRTLEFDTGFASLALLASAEKDQERAAEYLRLSKSYTNLWDSTNKAFRVKDPDGNWGPIENSKISWSPNPQGLFEGKTRDWQFAVPHDPYGMLSLPGQEGFVKRLTDYCLNDAWFNDYQEIYPYLLYYAGAPNKTQEIIRKSWVPLFDQGVMYEGVKAKAPHDGWQTHYTGVSGWLLCSMLGLYPSRAPSGQFIISSPSITRAVIHNGKASIRIVAKNNEGGNIYIRSIRVDGKIYPAYMIPAKRLAAGASIELEMGSDPTRGLGDLYIGSSDGFIQDAELPSSSRLNCTIEAPVGTAITKIHSRTKPAKIVVNGREDQTWEYAQASRTVTIHTMGTARIDVLCNLGNAR